MLRRVTTHPQNRGAALLGVGCDSNSARKAFFDGFFRPTIDVRSIFRAAARDEMWWISRILTAQSKLV